MENCLLHRIIGMKQLTNYEFFKIEINDKKSAPIDIVKAGIYETKEGRGGSTFKELKTSLNISDSAKKKTTWAHIVIYEILFADVFELKITEPSYFLRSTKVYAVEPDSIEFMKFYLQDLSLNSKSILRFNLNTVKTRELWLEIFNEDNPSLKITDA